MERKRVTYGVPGMLEFQVVLPFVGGGGLKVRFADGSATAYGVNPATYSTDNPIYQSVIENSAEYKRGRIVKVRETPLAPATSPAGNEEDTPQPAVRGGLESEAEETEVEFTSNDEAKDWLEKKCGAVRAKLRTRADIVAFGKAHGVAVSFAE